MDHSIANAGKLFTMRKAIVWGSIFMCVLVHTQVFGYQTRNVVVLVIDGSRYTETFGDSSHRYIPRMWNELRSFGTIYTRFYNDSITYTSPGHATIVTGTWQNISNSGSVRPQAPTIFEYFRKEAGISMNECYVMLGKDKLTILAHSNDATYGSSYGAAVAAGTNFYDDNATWNNIRYVLSTFHPRLSIANLGQVDAIGHQGNWPGYCASIRQADSIVGLVWNLLQNDPFYKDRTTLFIVNDHGRHTENFANHGDHCEGCRHLLCMMLGPDNEAGSIDTVYRRQIDIAPTIGELLGFATPYATGTPLIPVRRPAAPSPFQPKHGATITVDSVILAWDAPASEVTRYWLEIATDSLMDEIVVEDSTIAATRFISTLENEKTVYWWRVRASATAGWGNWSERKMFQAKIPVTDPAPENRDIFWAGIYGSKMSLNLRYMLSKTMNVSIALADLQGRLITSRHESHRKPGLNVTSIDVSTLSRGCYILCFRTDILLKKQMITVY